jgi:hypothetical protein
VRNISQISANKRTLLSLIETFIDFSLTTKCYSDCSLQLPRLSITHHPNFLSPLDPKLLIVFPEIYLSSCILRRRAFFYKRALLTLLTGPCAISSSKYASNATNSFQPFLISAVHALAQMFITYLLSTVIHVLYAHSWGYNKKNLIK